MDTHARAVVVGCATGIGRALVERAFADHMAVAMVDIDGDAVEAHAAEARARGETALAIAADVTDAAAMAAAADRCVTELGPLDVVFLNAGIQRQARFLDAPLEDHVRMINTNLVGIMGALRAFLDRLVEADRPARIVATASACAVYAPVELSSYNASKAGLLSLMETVHHELEAVDSPVRISVVLPGAVATSLHDWGRYGPSLHTDVLDEREARLRHVLARYGTDPAEVAESVFAGIAEDRFWLLPHPDVRDLARPRMEAFYAGENP